MRLVEAVRPKGEAKGGVGVARPKPILLDRFQT